MPVRKRRNKRVQAAGADEWFCAFESEFDLFGDLVGLVELDQHGRPASEEARKAWRLHGRAFLDDFAARYPNGAHFVPWALAEFGDPG
ncbi:hypothetical protein [Bradyrhizobium manausense]|uniref:hypothetical protein n=1 Tax=Bradyrhizobium manausense TaxID=989370 RepID=UPI000A8DA8E3|nr:hypothetical protein [Bradyrhizobium manausense]